MRRVILFCIALTLGTEVFSQDKLTTFILVRHAEKVMDGSKNPALTEIGMQRAQRLVTLLAKTQVDAIYSTNFQRTLQTVSPLAKAKGLSISTYDPSGMIAIDKIFAEHAGHTVVICGHSNNIPSIVNYLTASQKFNDFADDEYGNILIVTVSSIGKSASVTWLSY